MKTGEVHAAWQNAHETLGTMIRQSVHLADGGARQPMHHIDERLVQAIWHDQLLRADALQTCSGKRLEVLEPGRWNSQAGPDFLDARVSMAGEVLQGDVEIHVSSADWRNHRHHQDFAYNRVILHVVLHASDDQPYEEHQNGTRLERLVLLPHLDPDLETLRKTLNLEEYPHLKNGGLGLCHETFARLPEAQVAEFFSTAGRARMEDKIARLEGQSATVGAMQLVYQALMTGQGQGANKTLFFLLAKRAPVRELLDQVADVPEADRLDHVLSILLHVAQLLPTQVDPLREWDDEARHFAARLEYSWKSARPYFADRLIPPTRRWNAGIRPAAQPSRRLAAIAALVARLSHRADPLMPRIEELLRRAPAEDAPQRTWSRYIGELCNPLLVRDEHYFATHYSLGGKKVPPQALLGEEAARSALFNIFIPLAILGARRAGRHDDEVMAWRVAHRFPALPSNAITGFMKQRLLGGDPGDFSGFRREVQQQALFKIFSDCCSHNDRSCDACTFLGPPFHPR